MSIIILNVRYGVCAAHFRFTDPMTLLGAIYKIIYRSESQAIAMGRLKVVAKNSRDLKRQMKVASRRVIA